MSKIIVFSPHCDDLSLSLGGSVLNKYLNNITVYDVFSISDYTIINQCGGDKKEITSLRKEEERTRGIGQGANFAKNTGFHGGFLRRTHADIRRLGF